VAAAVGAVRSDNAGAGARFTWRLTTFRLARGRTRGLAKPFPSPVSLPTGLAAVEEVV
jgi:hypothetical protein